MRYSRFPSKLIIIINTILVYVQRINYRNVLECLSDVVNSGNISAVVGKRGRILGVVIFIFSFKNVSYVFVKIV